MVSGVGGAVMGRKGLSGGVGGPGRTGCPTQRGWIVLSGRRWNNGVELGERDQAGTRGMWTPLTALGAAVGTEGTSHWCHL